MRVSSKSNTYITKILQCDKFYCSLTPFPWTRVPFVKILIFQPPAHELRKWNIRDIWLGDWGVLEDNGVSSIWLLAEQVKLDLLTQLGLTIKLEIITWGQGNQSIKSELIKMRKGWGRGSGYEWARFLWIITWVSNWEVMWTNGDLGQSKVDRQINLKF